MTEEYWSKPWKPGDTISVMSPFEPESRWQKLWRIISMKPRKLRELTNQRQRRELT